MPMGAESFSNSATCPRHLEVPMGSEAGVQFDTNCGGDRLLLGRVEPPEMRAVPVGPFSACLFALDMQCSQ
jgi:hypothetical protein